LPGRSQPPARSVPEARKESLVASGAAIAAMYNARHEPARTRFTRPVKDRTLSPCRASLPTRI
jgi:hypothetical protein